MIYSSRFIVILDANVLYPAPLRDYLLHLASLGLYKPKWTNKIQDEWIRNLLTKRPDLKEASLRLTQGYMDSAFPDSNVTGYEDLIDGLKLPDPDDRHILAAAIKENADVIVTFNLKDFPGDYINTFDIEVLHPDRFINNLINQDKIKSVQALKNQVSSLRNPPRTINDVLITLEKCGLIESVKNLRESV